MEKMKAVILAVSIVSSGISISEGLVANTKLASQVRFVLSMVLMIVIFTPFLGASESIAMTSVDVFNEDVKYSEELYNNQIKKQVSENVELALGKELINNGINFENLEIEVNISETNSILISKVRIDTRDFTKAELIIKENLGREIEIINEN